MKPRRLTPEEIHRYDYIEHSDDEYIANVNDVDVQITKEQYKELRILEINQEIKEVESHLTNLKQQKKEIDNI
jgi:hypothetical protein